MVSSRAIEAFPPRGSYPCIHSIEIDGRALVQEFLDDLRDPDFSEFHANFGWLEDNGVLSAVPWRRMGNWFKPLRNVSDLWQLSATSHRLLGVRDRSRLILVHGFYKTGGETPRKDVEKAQELQRRYRNGR